jgi:hypothetical protein
MADEMYDEGAAPDEGAFPADSEEKSESTEDQLALVPKHFFKEEPKPGNREMVEIVEVYEGEVSIRCVYGEDKEEAEEPAPESVSAPTEAEDPSMM